MQMKEIRQIAEKMNIRLAKVDKADLIRAIQRAEGNADCYAIGGHECDQVNCLWRKDCMRAVSRS